MGESLLEARRTPTASSRSINAKLGALGNNTEYVGSRKNTGLQRNRDFRFYLQSEARKLFMGAGRKLNLEHPANFHATAKCNVQQVGTLTTIMGNGEQARYSGLMQCGRLWTCPVCSSRIQEHRAIEIGKAIAWAYSNGKKAMMLTLTHPHTRANTWALKNTLLKNAKVLRKLRESRQWKSLKDYGFAGLVRSLEVTIGKNGWHVHTHELLFVDDSADALEIKALIKKRYKQACQRYGLLNDAPAQLEAFEKYAVDIQDRANCSAYLAKAGGTQNWGADRELAKQSRKLGKSHKTQSPFSLLERSATGDRNAGELFLHYAKSMHGQRQLFWSHGLKQTVGIDELSDTAILEGNGDSTTEYEPQAHLNSKQWNLIIRSEARAELLNRVEKAQPYGAEAVQRAISSLLESLGALPNEAKPLPADTS